MQLTEFLDLYRAALADAVTCTYPPVYDAAMRQRRDIDLRRLLRRPLGAQADAIRATALALQQQGSALVVGEMGTGKSYIAAAAAYLAGYRRVLVLAPPHLVKKWQREIQQTIPGAQVVIVRTIGDLERARSLGGSLQFVVCSREQAKLGYRWQAVAVERWTRDEAGYPVRDELGRPLRRLCCPTCFTPLTDNEGVPLTWGDLEAKKAVCPACQGPLWQADRAGPRRYPLADYVRRRMQGYFELLIGDECHECAPRSAQN